MEIKNLKMNLTFKESSELKLRSISETLHSKTINKALNLYEIEMIYAIDIIRKIRKLQKSILSDKFIFIDKRTTSNKILIKIKFYEILIKFH